MFKEMKISVLALLIFTACICMPKLAEAAEEKQGMQNVSEEMRRAYREMIPLTGSADPVKEVRAIDIPADDPARKIPLKVYFPLTEKQEAALPVFLFIHGGGFVSGDFDTHDVLARGIANGASCIVVSVGYRLAPEHPFPSGLEDVYAALLWSRDNAADIGGDNAKIAVGGDSAGGNLAAALSLIARDRKGPKISGQWLMYPTLGNKMDTDSWARLGDEYFPTREVNSAIISAYVPKGKDPYGPLVAPLWAELENLPPTLIQAGGLDPLSDEGRDFVQKMKKSGGEATFLFYPEFQHGFIQFYKDEKNFPGAPAAFEQGLSWLREIYSRESATK